MRPHLMRELVPAPPPFVHNQFAEVRELFNRFVVPSYGRFELVLSHGAGSRVQSLASRTFTALGIGQKIDRG